MSTRSSNSSMPTPRNGETPKRRHDSASAPAYLALANSIETQIQANVFSPGELEKRDPAECSCAVPGYPPNRKARTDDLRPRSLGIGRSRWLCRARGSPENAQTACAAVAINKYRIAVAPGCIFSANGKNFHNCLRISCGYPWSPRIENAIETLGKLAKGARGKRICACARIGLRSRATGAACLETSLC